MQRKKLKFQTVLFGAFNFPADPATTVKLMTIFAPLGFMPQVMSNPDPMAGAVAQRMGLTKGNDMQIVFSPDRIDFAGMMPSRSIEEFVSDVVTSVANLESGSLKFNRVAIIVDDVIEDLTSAESEKLRENLLPGSEANAIEWTARWVTPCDSDGEKYNVCFEAIKATGMMMIVNGQMHPLSGVKVMHDVSTTPHDMSYRFDVKNLREELDVILRIISEQSHLIKF